MRVLSCPPSFKRFLAPSRASPPRLCARFLRFWAVGSGLVEARAGVVDPFSFSDGSVVEVASADRDALARCGRNAGRPSDIRMSELDEEELEKETRLQLEEERATM